MNFNFNHFAVTDADAAKALKKYIVRSDRNATIERCVMAGLFYICGRVIVAQYNEIVKLRKEAENKQKGD